VVHPIPETATFATESNIMTSEINIHTAHFVEWSDALSPPKYEVWNGEEIGSPEFAGLTRL
jgi:hypothetical protein